MWTRCAPETASPRFEIISYDSLINIQLNTRNLLTHNTLCVLSRILSSINDNHSDGLFIVISRLDCPLTRYMATTTSAKNRAVKSPVPQGYMATYVSQNQASGITASEELFTTAISWETLVVTQLHDDHVNPVCLWGR